MRLITRLVIAGSIEIAFVAATRLTIHYFSWQSVEAESIRTLLRILTATAYWWLFKGAILSRKLNPSTLMRPTLMIGLALFFSVPLLVGSYQVAGYVAVMFALTSVPVALKEEFLFRGIVQNLLSQKLGNVKAILLASAVFTVWHVGVKTPDAWVFVQIFFASTLLGLIYVGSGSIVAVIAVHAVYDALYFMPLTSIPQDASRGFIPLLAALGCVIYWGFSGDNGLTSRSSGRAKSGAPLS